MKTEILKEMQSVINNVYAEKKATTDFVGIIKRLNEEKYVPKNQLLQALIDYNLMVEGLLNGMAESVLKMSINYESQKEKLKRNQEYLEAVIVASEELNKFLDDLGILK